MPHPSLQLLAMTPFPTLRNVSSVGCAIEAAHTSGGASGAALPAVQAVLRFF